VLAQAIEVLHGAEEGMKLWSVEFESSSVFFYFYFLLFEIKTL